MREATGDRNYRDVNYVFPTFVTTHLPIGLIGIVLAAIMAAAMSSIAAELNALATTTVIDFYRRLLQPDAPDAHYLTVSRIATGFWGVFTCIVALFATNLGSLIEVVNRFGSFFYGSILGVFMLAMLTRRASGTGAFVGLIGGMTCVASVAFLRPEISFLWHNVIGAIGVVVIGSAVSVIVPAPAPDESVRASVTAAPVELLETGRVRRTRCPHTALVPSRPVRAPQPSRSEMVWPALSARPRLRFLALRCPAAGPWSRAAAPPSLAPT